ncbi:transcriptional corepressor SEUSS-like [Solanum tuberosum]|uniref:transcriptional corepressor SEUSS-like n=1 Tax=Solanum tuberosum TaxID=4113 RepID=UPI000739FF67|nr:PREDICTED: transcriptional corepressor SEUSS-like [Solanum tuberosum]
MANDNILLSPSAPLPEDQNVVAQPQHVPRPRHRPLKFKQIQDSSVSEKPFHSGNIISFGHSDPQGLFGSSGVSLQDNPKSLENLDKETTMSRPAPNHHITTNKEASAVIIKQESFVAPLFPEYTFRNEKKKLLEDAFAPTFSLMKLAYQQGMLSSSRLRFQENAKILEALDKERSMYRPGQTVLQSLEHHIAKNKEDGAVETNCECLVPPTILEESLRKGKQKLIEESFPPTFPQMNVASQLPSASLTNGPCPSRASQLNLLWLLQKKMQLSRTYEKLPAVVPDVRSIYTPEMCAQRLKLYMYRKQQRPRDNNIEFWMNLVAEFFAPNAKKRLCLSSNERRQLIGCIFPKDAWSCEICNVRPTAGFEISAEVLPRLCKLKYETGMLDELLYMDIPEESYTPSGHIVLNYPKVTEQTVYEAGRVVREGRLRIVFSADLKIRVWEFCCSFHEVYIGRKSVTPQVHQLKEAIQKYQVFAESSSRISPEEFQRTSNKFAPTIRELARTLDKSLINDLGYPKRYVRCLQISEIVSSMKDLMDYSKKYGIGPREAMAMIHRESAAVRVTQNSVAERVPQQHIDDVISQHSSVISFAPYPSTDEGTRSLNCSSPHATSPTSSTASSKRLVVHQADLVEPKRMKQMTNSGEKSVLRAPTEPVLNQSISTTHPSSFIRPPIVQPSVIVPSSTTSIEPNEYISSTVKVEQDLVTSQNLAVAAADATIDTKLVLDQNENIGKYLYGFETDGTVGKGYYMDQLENLNGASLFPGIHIEPPLSGTLMVNDTRSNNQQIIDQLPYLNGKMDPIDDIQFE